MANKYLTLDEIAETIVPQCKTSHFADLETNKTFEIGLNINYGTNVHVMGSKRLLQGRTVIPCSTANERHIHKNCEASMYVAEGTMVAYVGPEAKQVICPKGTFVYAPEGAIHGVTNPSTEEEVILIFCYSCNSNDASETIFVKEDPENPIYPPKGWDDPALAKAKRVVD